jgi:hypothetical protein
MSRVLVGLIVLSGMCLLTAPAFSQSSPDQKPVDCVVKDNIEDSACQKALKGLFTRKGDTLTLNLENGKSKKYTGNSAACSDDDVSKCIIFRVRRYFPQSHSYVIQRALYECGTYLFVNRRSGSETVMREIPTLSPNAQYALSIDQSDACERKYDIAIWSIEADPPKLEFKYQAKEYENWDVTAWEDDTHIKVKASGQQAELVRNEKGWALQSRKKTGASK